MKKALILASLSLYHYANGKKIEGNCSGLSGDCSGLYGDFDDCKLSETDRNNGISVSDMVKKQENTK